MCKLYGRCDAVDVSLEPVKALSFDDGGHVIHRAESKFAACSCHLMPVARNVALLALRSSLIWEIPGVYLGVGGKFDLQSRSMWM